MADPLLSYASEIAPVQPTTRFFDPAPGLGIMQRYGMSGASRAFAEDALKSANEIDKAANYDPINRRNNLELHEWNREAKDKADLAYEEKKEFENTLGTYLVEFARLDEDADDFDERLAQLIADPRALENEAVKAIYNLKVQQREQKSRQNEINAQRNNAVLESWSSAGFDPADITDETGVFNPGKAAQAKRRADVATLQTKAAEKTREDLDKFYSGDRVVIDTASPEALDLVVKDRKEGLLNAAKSQGVALTGDLDAQVSKAGTLDEAAFVAQTVRMSGAPMPENMTDQDFFKALLSGKIDNAPIRAVADAARGLWRAANRKQTLPVNTNKPGAASAPPDTDAQAYAEQVKKQLEELRRQQQQQPQQGK